ncbi:hypothetical protein TH53_11285 [Pedobacter lusitanus]|uniref:Uncharacterized protein n=1 Tax=Pedobacter lusitanus TaxID=1503925 RepID=A0A0D0GIL3_9SPHI|nr:hypothetical protein TH53_11285 [Pedobacter lusitanus]
MLYVPFAVASLLYNRFSTSLNPFRTTVQPEEKDMIRILWKFRKIRLQKKGFLPEAGWQSNEMRFIERSCLKKDNTRFFV